MEMVAFCEITSATRVKHSDFSDGLICFISKYSRRSTFPSSLSSVSFFFANSSTLTSGFFEVLLVSFFSSSIRVRSSLQRSRLFWRCFVVSDNTKRETPVPP